MRKKNYERGCKKNCKRKCGEEGCRQESLLTSLKTFPDGANYRIEVSGIETAEILLAVVDEAKKLGIPIHRAIATVRGSKFYDNEQLKKLAEVATNNRIEVIICPDNLAQAIIDDPNKIFTGLNWQSNKEAGAYYKEVRRCARLGFQGFLVWRKGMLDALNKVRESDIGILIGMPAEVIFKLSTFDNNANMADFVVGERLGADTINTANNLTLENLYHIRRAIHVPMDVHITFWQLAFEKNANSRLELVVNPYDRINDAPEIARVSSPVYFKFEAGTPGIGVYNVPREGWTLKDLAEHKRGDVRTAAEIVRRIEKEYPQLKLSDWGPEDLRVPVVNQNTTDFIVDSNGNAKKVMKVKRR